MVLNQVVEDRGEKSSRQKGSRKIAGIEMNALGKIVLV